MPPPPPDAARALFSILIIIIYLYSSPDAGPQGSGFHSPRELYQNKLNRQHHALDVLNTSRYGDFAPNDRGGTYLNLTGFKKEDGYAWEDIDKVQDKVAALRQHEVKDGKMGVGMGMYGNITGLVKGKWVRAASEGIEWGRSQEMMNLTEIAPEITWGWNTWTRNLTGIGDSLRLNLEERAAWGKFLDDDHIRAQKLRPEDENADEYVREIAATMMIQDDTAMGDGWEMRVHGVHWPRRGFMVMTTTSEKFYGIFGLPNMMSTKEDFMSSQRVLNRTLGAALRRKERSVWIDLSDPWSSDDAMPMPHCEFIVFAQVHPVKDYELRKSIKPTDKIDLMTDVHDIERELRFPSGAPVYSPPPLRMSVVAFSPDCGFLLESKGPPEYPATEGEHLQGVKQEVYIQRIKHWSLIWTAILVAQALLIRAQMKESSTPSTVSRVSLYTISMMLVADAFIFGCMLLMASSVSEVFPTATLTAFAVTLSLGMGVKFIGDVYNVQEPERLERQRVQLQATEAARAARLAILAARTGQSNTAENTNTTQDPPPTVSSTQSPAAPVLTAAGAETLPVPVTATTTAPSDVPIIIPSDQDIDAEIASVTNTTARPTNLAAARTALAQQSARANNASAFGQSMMLFMCFFFLTISSTSWPPTLRSIYFTILSFLYLSLWTPQIYRNVFRNCRQALLWKFVLGQSLLRAAPFAYFYLKKDNVLFADPSPWTMGFLALWLLLQVQILIAQSILGPRFGLSKLPKGWLPEAWDYHPILREDDAEGGGMPIGLVKSASGTASGSPSLSRVQTGEEGARRKQDSHTRSVDCAICMNSLEVPVVPAGQDADSAAQGGPSSVAGILARRVYMVTPCRHVFHSACLGGWMKYRLRCPICRETLPPL